MSRFSTAIVIGTLGIVPASAQDKPPAAPGAPINRCAPLAGKVTATTPSSSPQLFILTSGGWQEIVYDPFWTDLTIDSYRGGQLSFIYVVPPSDVRNRQFLSIRTIADTTLPDNFVNLRRNLDDFDTVYYGTYQDYHLNGKPSGTLRRFHTWPNGEHSDTPIDTRQSWTFQSTSEIARHRVLAISYQATNTALCVPFSLGPNIAASAVGLEGDDQITIFKDFSVEITEAKTASGFSGRTFKIRSSPSKVP
jgi:hypothetical protein